jgi:Ion channel
VIVTISTVGYGDRNPVTNEGRFLGTLIIVVGVGIFGTFTGYLSALSNEQAVVRGRTVRATEATITARRRRSRRSWGRPHHLGFEVSDGLRGPHRAGWVVSSSGPRRADRLR